MDSIVSFVVEKLGCLIEEARLFGGVGKQVKQMERELNIIQQCLQDAYSKRCKGDTRAEQWLCSLREVAYRIEDAIDTFYVELGDEYHEEEIEDEHNRLQEKCRRLFGRVRDMWRKAMNVLVIHKLGKELGDIQKELDEIFKRKDIYEITITPPQDLGASAGTKSAIVPPVRREIYQDVDETEVVGLNADMYNILQLLCGTQNPPRRSVITIVGPGGIGKTTLARKVYNRHVNIFGYIFFFFKSSSINHNSVILGRVKVSLWCFPKYNF